MSTYYDLHCFSCGKAANFYVRNNEEILKRLWENRCEISGAIFTLTEASSDIELDLYLYGDEAYALKDFPDFVGMHATCFVRVVNEYEKVPRSD